MCSEPPAIRTQDLGKRYQIYAHPADRLRQFLIDGWYRLTGLSLPPRYRDFCALQGLSVTLRRGETVGIIGRNGSGKSTLLQLICGTLNPSEGQVESHGRIAALLELGSGFNPEFSGRENVMLYATVLGLSHQQALARFDDIVAFADIGDFLDQPVKTYSSGMTVRLAFAVIAHVDADILVVDEALAVGDAFFTQKCMRFLREFMVRGTVLLVSHDTEAIKALCQRVLWLEHGRLMQDGPTKEVCEAYLDRLLISHHQAAAEAETQTSAIAPNLDWNGQATRLSDNLVHLSAMPLLDAGASLGGATVRKVQILSAEGKPMHRVLGGGRVLLCIEVLFHQDMVRPLIGFMVKDRTGQALFGDNTRMTPMPDGPLVEAGRHLKVTFAFEMPFLPSGEYSTVVAVAEGTQDQHLHHHWIHDALHLRSENGTTVHGLVGIPMRKIEVQTMDLSKD